MDKIYYQPNHLWKEQKAVKKLKELSKEKPKAVKQWLSQQAFWQVHLPAPKCSCRLWHGSRGVILKNRKNLNKLLVFEALYL